MAKNFDKRNKLEAAIYTFERAVLRHDELGAIPVYSEDREEQLLIDKTRAAIKREYTRARNHLIAVAMKEAAPNGVGGSVGATTGLRVSVGDGGEE